MLSACRVGNREVDEAKAHRDDAGDKDANDGPCTHRSDRKLLVLVRMRVWISLVRVYEADIEHDKQKGRVEEHATYEGVVVQLITHPTPSRVVEALLLRLCKLKVLGCHFEAFGGSSIVVKQFVAQLYEFPAHQSAVIIKIFSI